MKVIVYGEARENLSPFFSLIFTKAYCFISRIPRTAAAVIRASGVVTNSVGMGTGMEICCTLVYV